MALLSSSSDVNTQSNEHQNANPLVTHLIRLADDHLILGHRLSEWCGHAPMLEEDLALPNIALDLIGQASALYHYAGELEGLGRDEDQIAFEREIDAYTNLLLCEIPNGDFAHTMLRQMFFSVFMEAYWGSVVSVSTDATVTAIANKAIKESTYHVRHCAEWTIRLGDGTDESARRLSNALEQLTPYLSEFFYTDEVTEATASAKTLPAPTSLESTWQRETTHILSLAKLTLPDYPEAEQSGRQGEHTDEMVELLAELQFVQRSYPNMQW